VNESLQRTAQMLINAQKKHVEIYPEQARKVFAQQPDLAENPLLVQHKPSGSKSPVNKQKIKDNVVCVKHL
jgi:hypothetical protein